MRGLQVWAVGRGVRVVLGALAEVSADWVVVDVRAIGEEIFAVAHAAVGEASLPDGEFGGEAVGEASLMSWIERSRVMSVGVRRRWMWSGMTTKAWSL